MSRYNKDYSAKTAKEWLSEGKWKAFLMSVPIDKAVGYPCDDSNFIMRIRVTASMLNKDEECDRRFKVTADFDTRIVTITATRKTEQP